MAEGGYQWTPLQEKWTPPRSGPSHTDQVDRVWTSNRVYIMKKKSNLTGYFDLQDDICLIQFLFKHYKDDLTKPNGWEYENHNGVPYIYISNDGFVEKCLENVKEWISKFQNLIEVRKLELSSGNTEYSLQRSLSYLTPECIDGKADVFYDESHDCLYIVGFHQTVYDIFRKTKAAIQNEEMTKKAKENVIHLDSKSHGILLREFGFLDKLRRDFPNDSIRLLDCNTKVIYTGAQNDAEKCRKAIAQFISGICTEILKMSPVKTGLLSKPGVKTYVNEALQANKIPCVWEVVSSGQLQLMCSQKKDLEEAHVKIEENIKEEVLSAREYTQLRETSSKRFGLNESQLGKVFVRHTKENTHVAATTDVMDHIIRWLQSTYPDESDGSEHHRQSAAKESKKLPERLQVQELDLELWKALSIADACSKVPERRCTIENNCFVIEALEGDLTKIVEEIKEILDRVKKAKVTVSLQSDCAALLRNKEAEHYVNQELGKKHLRCVWKIGSNGDTVDVYTLPVKEAVNAGKIIDESVSLVSLSKKFTHVKRLLEEKDVMKVRQKHHGKVNIFSKTDDVCLVATADAMKDILPVMKAFHEELNTSVSVLLEMPEGICRFVLERNPKFVKKLQEDFGIELRPTGNKNQIEIFGRRQNIDIAKSVLEKETGEIQSDSETMMFLPNVLATEREQSKFEAVNHCYISVEKEIVAKKPCPSHTWIVSKSPYMMLVPGNITEADVYAVMCPVDRRMNPIGAGKDIMMCGKNCVDYLHLAYL
ncbi:uncharacterized protein [Argopecten irradians]|uniref:uncharacterized protein n=1 Tax=Argopecten irradians TaxID=31199 RepID=UPI00371535D1